jgi:hypothetical protein
MGSLNCPPLQFLVVWEKLNPYNEIVGSSPSEPANYADSYTTEAKEIAADIEIAMYRSAGIIILAGSLSICHEG